MKSTMGEISRNYLTIGENNPRVISGPQELHFLEPYDQRWMDFITTRAESNIFHHPIWLRTLSECYGYKPFVLAIFSSRKDIRAGLPMVEINSTLTGRRWSSLPFTDHCMPLYRDSESLFDLTQLLVKTREERSIPSIELRWQYPDHREINTTVQNVLSTVPLSPQIEEVKNRIKRKHFRMIAVSKDRGVKIIRDNTPESLETFYKLQLTTRRKHGVPIQPKRFFLQLWKNIIEPGLGFILLAYKGEQPLAGGIFLCWHQTLVYKYSASSGQDKEMSPNDPLMWSAICWGCENGYTLLDMGKSEISNQGLRYFKKRWGAEENPMVYSSISTNSNPQKNTRLINLMQPILQKSPPWVCRLSGELLYKHFG